MEGVAITMENSLHRDILSVVSEDEATKANEDGPVLPSLLTRFTNFFGSDDALNTSKIVMGFGTALIVADIFATGGVVSKPALAIGGGILATGAALRIVHLGVSLSAPDSETLQFFKDPFHAKSVEAIKDSFKELSAYLLLMGLDAILSELIATMVVTTSTLTMGIPLVAVGASGLVGFLGYRIYKDCTDSSDQQFEGTPLIITNLTIQ